MKEQKTYLIVTVIMLILFGIGLTVNNQSLQNLTYFGAFTSLIILTGLLLKQSKTKNILKNIYGEQSKDGTNSFEECKQIAKDFADKEYANTPGKNIDFDWSNAKTDLGWVYDLRNQEFIESRYFYTPNGPHDTGTYIFIDATNGKFMSSQPAGKKSQREDPFSTLEAYDKKMVRRIASIQARQDNTDNGLHGLDINMGFNGENEE